MKPDHDYKYGRWEKKYDIRKADGSDVDPKAEYFVLRLDGDPNAREAATAYATSVMFDNPLFASDILQRVWKHGGSRDMNDEMRRVADMLADIVQDAKGEGFVPHTERMNRHLDKLQAEADQSRNERKDKT